MYKNSLKLLFRNLLKNKLNSTIIILSLTLGLSSAFIVFSWAVFEYSYDNFHEKGERIYRVLNHQTPKGQGQKYLASVPEYLVNTFENEIPGIELSTVLVGVGSFWTNKGEANVEIKKVFYSDNNLFNLFSFKFLSGDPKTSLSRANSAVITKSVAEKLFGDANPLGKTIKRNRNKEYIISGIIDEVATNSHLKFNMLLSVEERKPNWDTNNGNHNAAIYVLLDKGVKVNDLRANLDLHLKKYLPWNIGTDKFELQPLKDLHLNSKHTIWELNWNKFDKKYVQILIVITFLILIISSINYFNLTIVGLSKRNTEIGIKKINGSNSWQIIRQFIIEHSFITGISCLLAILLVYYSFPYFQDNFFNGYKLSNVFSTLNTVLCISFIFILCLLAGLIPALFYSSASPILILSKRVYSKTKGGTAKNTLVIFQLAFTTFLIIASIAILKQMHFIRNVDLGVNTAQIIALPTNDKIRKNYDLLKEELLKNPNVYSVSASSCGLGYNFWRNSINFEGQEPDSRYVIPYLITDFNFVDFYSMEIVEGRKFSKEMNLDRNGLGFIINESLARELGFENPVGKRMRFGHTREGEIIGVVKDFHYRSLHNPIEPMAFYTGEGPLLEIQAKLNTANIDETLGFINELWSEYRPDRPFTYQFMDSRFANLYEKETKMIKLVLLFSILSIVLSSLGLFGLISFVAELKTKEIGIRKVNGARIGEVMIFLSRNYLIWGLLAWTATIPASWYILNGWLENFAYKTSLNWWIYALAGVATMGIAVLSVSWQSWRAATRNPVEALRYE
jgi:putative ABC transport system permease protein